jgi:hypothetical protein
LVAITRSVETYFPTSRPGAFGIGVTIRKLALRRRSSRRRRINPDMLPPQLESCPVPRCGGSEYACAFLIPNPRRTWLAALTRRIPAASCNSPRIADMVLSLRSDDVGCPFSSR